VSLSGNVWYYPASYPASQPWSNGVGGVSVGVSGALTTNVLSAGDGSYGFSTLWSGQAYEVTPAKAEDTPTANGVTTLDIALIRRHILALGLLDSPYELLAADVTHAGSISTLDIALIRNLILGLTNTFPAGLWRFVPADYVFPDPANPWDAPADRSYQSLTANLAGQDFVAIKHGDVNGSWVDPGPGPQVAGGRAAGPGARAELVLPPVRFAASRQVAEPGQRVGVRVSVGALAGLSSAQFTLGWDARVLRYAGVGEYGLRGLGEGNFGTMLAPSGKLTFSWDDPEGKGLEAAEGAPVFTVDFEVIGAAGKVSAVAFGDSPTPREASVGFARRALAGEDGQVAVAGARPVVWWSGDPSQGTFRICVPSASGRRYVLEFTDSFSGVNWRALEAVEGDGSIKSLADPTGTARQRFYRVRVE
jgi:hypothetical protein